MQERSQTARILEQHFDTILKDAVAIFPFAGAESSDHDRSANLADLILQLLTTAVREGELDQRTGRVSDLRQLALDFGLTVRQLFGLVYVIERAALDELALDESFGATSEAWPGVAQMVRRASFDVLAAVAERITREPDQSALHDSLTALHTRAVLLAALEKEIRRAERFLHPFALILVDVDHLSAINAKHGYGFGDRVLERIGIVIRNYFREHDWVTRCSEDTFAILLPETARANAELLADGLRVTVEERLALRDYRTEEQVQVTVSVAVLIGDGQSSNNADKVLRQAEEAVVLAKERGRNRVEVVEIGGTRVPRPARARGV
ncbi:MAG TPA: GGDEF domain-containing protein [Vicinamibacterales bacterium]|nr:GGDEF domain-containing protein [Vicinamibacterales bacterium]